MAGLEKLPEDYRVDALAKEARRRENLLGKPYSYGKLVADTTEEEREKIGCAYWEEKAKRNK